MNDIVKRMTHLITGYLRGSLDPSEQRELEQWIRESEDNRQLFESLTDPANLRAALNRFGEKRQLMLDRIRDSIAINRIHRSAWWHIWGRCIAVAAVVSLLFIVAWYLMNKNTLRYTTSNMPDPYGDDVQFGSDQSRLTLSDGSVIILIDSINGVLATDASSKAQVIKEHGWLSYRNSAPGDSLYFNMLQVPRKGQRRVLLPDGSRAWLNTGSSLRYPIAFSTRERRVELQGEAYFEVTSMPSQPTADNTPFIVDLPGATSSTQLVMSGARFNAKAYPDEPITYITLVEGDLKLNRGHQILTLQPRQQARLEHNGQIAIFNQANPEEAIAWKEVNQ
jgi:ferric-dicitrate binding protein FerR (iron transport regulator)